MATDAQIPPETRIQPARRGRLLAPWWHTVIVVAVLLLLSLGGSQGKHPLAARSRLPQYVWTMAWEWMMTGIVWLGIRKRIRLRELIGGRWATMEDFFLDVVFAGTFWGCAMLVLGVAATLMHLDRAGHFESMRKQIGFLRPNGGVELAVWYCVSVTAGFCEEIIFRGYLQQQFAAIANSMLAGVVVSALVFGASHGYEGASTMVLLGIFGLLFGLLAWWRKSLRAGMMAHAWHDALVGTLLRVLK